MRRVDKSQILKQSRKALNPAFRLIFSGVSDSLARIDKQRILVINLFALIPVLINLFLFIPYYTIIGSYRFALIMILMCPIYLASILLNHLHKYNFAKYFFLFSACAGITFQSISQGSKGSIYLLLYTCMALTCFLFDARHKYTLGFAILVHIALIWLCTFGESLVQGYLPKGTVSSFQADVTSFSFTVLNLILLAGMVIYFLSKSEQHEARLGAVLERQYIAYGLVVHDASSYLHTIQAALSGLHTVESGDEDFIEIKGILSTNVSRLGTLLSELRKCLQLQESTKVSGSPYDALLSVVALIEARGLRAEATIKIATDLKDIYVAMTNADMLHVYDNIITNALRNLSENNVPEPLIIIEPSRTQEEKFFSLRLTDNGTGLSTEYFERLTVPLKEESSDRTRVSVHDMRSRKSHGLSLVRKLITQSGGKISCESPALDQNSGARMFLETPGTTFLIELPFA